MAWLGHAALHALDIVEQFGQAKQINVYLLMEVSPCRNPTDPKKHFFSDIKQIKNNLPTNL